MALSTSVFIVKSLSPDVVDTDGHPMEVLVAQEMEATDLDHVLLPKPVSPFRLGSDLSTLEVEAIDYVFMQCLHDGRRLYAPRDVLIRTAYQTMIVTRLSYERHSSHLSADLIRMVSLLVAETYQHLPVMVIEDVVKLKRDPDDPLDFDAGHWQTARLVGARTIAIDKLTRVKARLLG